MNFLDEDDPRRLVWAACESPIEQMLACGLFAILGCHAVNGPYRRSRRPELAELAGSTATAFAFGQHWIQTTTSDRHYRTDFLLVLIDPGPRLSRHIVIECDGKDFHTAPDQVTLDQQRDAEILAAGYHAVRRFSGRQIYADITNTIANDLARFNVTTGIPEDCTDFVELFLRMSTVPALAKRMTIDPLDMFEPPIYGSYYTKPQNTDSFI